MKGEMKMKTTMKILSFCAALWCVLHAFSFSYAQGSSKVFQGEVTFQYYCSGCHGVYGRGDGPSAKGIYKTLGIAPRNLSDEKFQKSLTDDQLVKAISGGVHGKTEKPLKMPAWGKTFTKDEIRNIVAYVRTLPAKKIELNQKDIEIGKGIFVTRCSLCHGLSGRGDGPYIKEQLKKNPKHPQPPDFTDAAYVQTLSENEISDTIYKGGGHSGKSDVMPAWWKTLSKNDIHDLAEFVKSFPKMKK